MDYSEIANALIREIESNILLGLDVNFYREAKEYIKKIEERSTEIDRYEAKILRLSLERLFLIRIKKALDYIWREGKKPDITLPLEEAEVIDRVFSLVQEFRKIMLEPEGSSDVIIESKEVVKASEEKRVREKNVLVFFLQPYTKVTVGGGRVLGPFAKGDLAFIPLSVAKELEDQGVVEVLG